MKYCITGTGYKSPLFDSLTKEVSIIPDHAIEKLTFTADDKIYVPSEDALSGVINKMAHAENKRAIQLFKDKAAFRNFIAPLFPEFYFAKVKLSELSAVQLDFSMDRQYMIKPVRGFFGTGVQIIDKTTNLAALEQRLEAEVAAKAAYFLGDILSQTEFLIEEFIGGVEKGDLDSLENAEIAVDLYYDREGVPVIVGIYHHPMPVHSEYFHVLYYTSKALFSLQDQILAFFYQLQDLGLNLQSFPLHAEFKQVGGKLIPIEINPCRFGGFGLADIPYHAFGINPFKLFYEDKAPNWTAIWKEHEAHYYGWVLGYNGTCMNLAHNQPDPAKFEHFLQPNLLAYYPVDYRKMPVFALAYIDTVNTEDLTAILQIDFNDYLIAG